MMEAPLRKRCRANTYAWRTFIAVLKRCMNTQQPAESGATIHGHVIEIRTRRLRMHGVEFVTCTYFMDNQAITPAVLGDALNRLVDEFEKVDPNEN